MRQLPAPRGNMRGQLCPGTIQLHLLPRAALQQSTTIALRVSILLIPARKHPLVRLGNAVVSPVVVHRLC